MPRLYWHHFAVTFVQFEVCSIKHVLWDISRFFTKFVIMSIVKFEANKGTSAVKKLREQKLRSGLPFMINVEELSSNQCYLEYPNGTIKLVNVAPASRDIDIVRELSTAEANLLRNRFHFSTIR
jgi:hypothetical protein